MCRLLAFVALCLAIAGPVRPQGLDASPEVAAVTLIPGWRRDDGTHLAAIAIRLAPGWHTYWRMPGAAGLPPQFDWAGSTNLAAAEPVWPRPKVIETAGAPSLGYLDELVLPVVLTPAQEDAPIELDLALFFGVCETICVPAQTRLHATLAPDAPPKGRKRIEAALARRPLPAVAAGVAQAACTLEPAASGYTLTAEITFDAAPAPNQTAVIESARPDLWIGAPQTRTRDRTVTATAPVEPGSSGSLVLDRSALRITVLDNDRAVDIHGCAAPG